MFWIGLTVSLAALDLGLKELVEERDDGEFPVEMPKTRGKIMLNKSHNSGLPFGKNDSDCGSIFRFWGFCLCNGEERENWGEDCPFYGFGRSSQQHNRPLQAWVCS